MVVIVFFLLSMNFSIYITYFSKSALALFIIISLLTTSFYFPTYAEETLTQEDSEKEVISEVENTEVSVEGLQTDDEGILWIGSEQAPWIEDEGVMEQYIPVEKKEDDLEEERQQELEEQRERKAMELAKEKEREQRDVEARKDNKPKTPLEALEGKYVPGQFIVSYKISTATIQPFRVNETQPKTEGPNPRNLLGDEDVTASLGPIGVVSEKLKDLGIEEPVVVNTIPGSNSEVVSIGTTVDLYDAMSEIAKLPGVDYVQPNFIYKVETAGTSTTVVDPLLDDSWHLNAIDAFGMWKVIKEEVKDKGKSIGKPILGVVDEGVAFDHPEFTDRAWTAKPCRDEYGNIISKSIQKGILIISVPATCTKGRGFGDNRKDVSFTASDHGTVVAGVAVGNRNNGQGSAGVSQNAQLIAFNATNHIRDGLTTDGVVNAIDFAKHNDVDILNLSFGSLLENEECRYTRWGKNNLFRQEYDVLKRFEGIVVAAAGNSGRETGKGDYLNLPSNFGLTVYYKDKKEKCWEPLENIIVVGGTENKGTDSTPIEHKAFFSNYGGGIDIVAPAHGIVAPFFNDMYDVTGGNVGRIKVVNGSKPDGANVKENSFWSVADEVARKGEDNYVGHQTLTLNTKSEGATNKVYKSKAISLPKVTSRQYFLRGDISCLLMENPKNAKGVKFDEVKIEFSKKVLNIVRDNFADVATIKLNDDYEVKEGVKISIPIEDKYLTDKFKYRLSLNRGSKIYSDCKFKRFGVWYREEYTATTNNVIFDEDSSKDNRNADYKKEEGTSFAAPQVAAVLAEMKAVNPFLTNTEIKKRLLESADELVSLLKDCKIDSDTLTDTTNKEENDYVHRGRRLNAANAIRSALNLPLINQKKITSDVVKKCESPSIVTPTPVANTPDSDGDGLLEISTAEELNNVRYNLEGTSYKTSSSAEGVTTGCPTTGCKGYELVADIDLAGTAWASGEGWVPIGFDEDGSDDEFIGTFEGNGKSIKNLFINQPNQDDVGLFSLISSGAKVQNLILTNVNLTGDDYVGAIAGYVDNENTVVENIFVSGTVKGDGEIGGVFGRFDDGTAKRIASHVTVTGDYEIGGIAGEVRDADIENTYYAGIATGIEEDETGGIAGYMRGGTLKNVYTAAIIKYTDGTKGDAIIGESTTSTPVTITSTYYNSDLSSSSYGTRKTTSELQSGTVSSSIYTGWSTSIWTFGITSQYPRLGLEPNATVIAPKAPKQPVKQTVDKDSDGLIDIATVEQLNNIRYNLEGTSYKTSDSDTGTTVGCPSSGCNGYELTKDIDFDDSRWDSGDGWMPIGDNSDPFEAHFNGNDYEIDALYINRSSTDYLGLFGAIEGSYDVENIVFTDADIEGDDKIGVLAGRISDGVDVGDIKIENADVVGDDYVGGLTGILEDTTTDILGRVLIYNSDIEGDYYVGGVAGDSEKAGISQAAVEDVFIEGDSNVGGLVGRGRGVIIANSYVSDTEIDKLDSDEEEVGGVIGDTDTDAMTWVYTSVDIGSSRNEQGIVGEWARASEKPNVLFSYYDSTKTTSQSLSGTVRGKTTTELKRGTASPLTTNFATIYNSWSTSTWDFRTSRLLPRLKALDY